METEIGTVSKGGEIMLQTTFSRVARGLLVNVKTHPKIETFMRELGSGQEIQDAGMYGRLWTSTRKDEGLPVYGLPAEEALTGWIRNGSGPLYRVDKIGARISEYVEGAQGINMSFLRLVGSSEGSGVSFIVDGVYGAEALKDLRQAVGEAARGLYMNFLRPVNVSIILSTQDI